MSGITKKIENPAFPLRSTYVLARLSRVVQRLLEGLLISYGLTLPQYSTLAVLIRRPGLSNAQLARRAYITAQSMQEVLRTLENKGLVRRIPAPENQRILRASLTPSGTRLTIKAERDASAVEDGMLAGLTPSERAQFVKSLQKCVVRLGGGLQTPASRRT